jgi:hypothetical protein
MAMDSGLLDLKILALPHGLQTASSKPGADNPLDNLFSQWLSLPDTQRLVRYPVSLSRFPTFGLPLPSLGSACGFPCTELLELNFCRPSETRFRQLGALRL